MKWSVLIYALLFTLFVFSLGYTLGHQRAHWDEQARFQSQLTYTYLHVASCPGDEIPKAYLLKGLESSS